MPQTSYTLETGKIGELAVSDMGQVGSKLNPLVAHVWTATVGGTATDGVYSFRVKQDSEETGTLVSITRTGGSPASNTDLATALAAAGEAIAALRNVANFTSAAAVVTVTAIQFGVRFDLTEATATAPGTLTLANTVDSVGTTIEVGRCLVRHASVANAIALPSSASVTANVQGFALRGADMNANTGDPWDVDGYPPGAQVPVVFERPMFVESETTASEGDSVYIRRIASTSQKLGVVRNSGDGTPRVETVTPTAVNDQQYSLRIMVNADGNGWEEYVIAALGDGSATATEICDDYRTQLAAITALTGVITGSGTATLILTGAAGVEFAATDLGPGVSAVVETTAGTFETFRLLNAEYDRAAAAAGRARIRMNLPRI